MGAGLISGAVVHHPLDPARYTKIAVIGVLVFLVATLVNEFLLAADRPALPRAILVIAASLLLSFGIGMLSGGLQHFEDFPDRGAVFVPLGITVSFIAFVLKDPESSWRRVFGPLGLAVLLTATVSFFGLRTIAEGLGETSGESGPSHGGGSARARSRGGVLRTLLRAHGIGGERLHRGGVRSRGGRPQPLKSEGARIKYLLSYLAKIG